MRQSSLHETTHATTSRTSKAPPELSASSRKYPGNSKHMSKFYAYSFFVQTSPIHSAEKREAARVLSMLASQPGALSALSRAVEAGDDVSCFAMSCHPMGFF